MNVPSSTSSVAEINRLHDDVKRCSTASRNSLHVALAAAWKAGRLLTQEKQRVRARMGAGAWISWLTENFEGTPRTAQRYMQLGQKVAQLSALRGMSLRQVYSRLGIATEPKKTGRTQLRHSLPMHVVLSNRLLRTIRQQAKSGGPADAADYRRDLRLLYDELRPLFERDQSSASVFTSQTTGDNR